MNIRKTLFVLPLAASVLLLAGCGEDISNNPSPVLSSTGDTSSSAPVSSSKEDSSSSSKERKPECLALESSLNGVFSSDSQKWNLASLDFSLGIGKQGELDESTGVRAADTAMYIAGTSSSVSLACNGTKGTDPLALSAELDIDGLKVSQGNAPDNLAPLFMEDDGTGTSVETPQNVKGYLSGYDAYYDLSKANAGYGALVYLLSAYLDNAGYDVSSWTVPQQGHYAIDGDLKTKYTNDIFPMLGQYLPQIGTMEVAMLEMAYDANPSDFVVTNDNGHYTFTADTTNVAHLYSNVESVLNSLGVDVLITKQDLPMLSEDLTVEGALKWVKAVTDSMTINKLKVTFDYTATVFNKVDVDIDVVWDEAKIKADLAAKGDTASWPLAFKLATSASAKTGDEAKITLPDFAGYTDFVMPPKKAAA